MDRFEVGNAVWAYGRLTSVEKVYQNGNFKLAGIDGQWRQGGWKAGSNGYHTPKCHHYTETLARQIAAEKARQNLKNAIDALERRRNHLPPLAIETTDALTAKINEVIAALSEGEKS